MGFKEGHGLGKNLQGRALPIQVVKRQGKGAVGRYGNEDPNRVRSTEGNETYSYFDYGIQVLFFIEPPVDESGKKSKKNAAPSAPQWRRQPREVIPLFPFNSLNKKETLILFVHLESTTRTLCL